MRTALACLAGVLATLSFLAPTVRAQKPPPQGDDDAWRRRAEVSSSEATRTHDVPELPADLVHVELLGENGSADIDLEVTSGERTWSSASTEATERILVAGGTDGLEVLVTHYSGDACPYELVCTPLVPQGTLRPGRTLEGRVSYETGRYVLFEVDLPSGSFGSVRLQGEDGVGDLDLYAYDEDLEEVGSSLSPTSEEMVVVAPGQVIAVQAYDEDTSGTFDLRLETEIEARDLAFDEPTDGAVREAQGEAFYRVTAPADGILDISVDGGGETDLDLQIVGSDGLSKLSNDREAIERAAFHATDGASYLVRVYGYGSDDRGPFDITASFHEEAWTGERPTGEEPVWFGIFVGIEDYRAINALSYTCKDALDAYATLLEGGTTITPGRSIVLLDDRADVAGLEEAFRRVAEVARPRDRFVFFYSGHGGDEVPDENGDEVDGDDEYLVAFDSNNFDYSGDIVDDDLADLFDAVPCRSQTLLVDMCFGGGLARDIVDRPGRYGIFSSSENRVSAEGVGFKAGLLAGVMFRGLRGDADANDDGRVTRSELGDYIAHTLPRTCPACQAHLERNTRSCGECGRDLTGDGRPQIPVVADDRTDEDPVLSRVGVATGDDDEEEGEFFKPRSGDR